MSKFDAAILFLRSLLKAKPYGDADGLKLYEHNFGWDTRDKSDFQNAISVLEAAAKVDVVEDWVMVEKAVDYYGNERASASWVRICGILAALPDDTDAKEKP